MSEKPAVYFGMPLRSSVTTRDWPLVCNLFHNTIRSIQGQTDGDFRILVACHERPDLGALDEPRLEFLDADNPRPVDIPTQMTDKRHKIRMLAEEICRRGGGYFFLMDADDLVSSQIVEHVRRSHNGRGYVVAHGYVLNIGRRTLTEVPDFWRHCGTCAIFYLTPDDLERREEGLPARLAGRLGHGRYGSVSAECGRPLEPLPFPAAVYIRNHGENRSSQRRPWKLNFARNWLFRTAKLFRGLRPIPEALREEFAIPYRADGPRHLSR